MNPANAATCMEILGDITANMAAMAKKLNPVCDTNDLEQLSDTFQNIGKTIGLIAVVGAIKKVGPTAIDAAKGFADPKLAAQLETQLAKDGAKSIHKSLSSFEKRLAEHL